MNELMIQLQPIIINAAVVTLTTVASFVGVKIKCFIEEKINTEMKKKIVETTCRFINQLYKDLEGNKKLEIAKKYILQQLNEKNITISELEMNVLIESTVNSFQSSVQ